MKCYVYMNNFTNFNHNLRPTPDIRRVLDHKSSFLIKSKKY